MLVLPLCQIPPTVLGTYPLIDGKANRSPSGLLPERFRWLEPSAAASFMRMDSRWDRRPRASDMLRSAAESLHAIETKTGTKAPGLSGHGYGICIDVDVEDCLQRFGLRTKVELDHWMQDNGWWCHRKDGKLGPESWHYSFFGDQADHFGVNQVDEYDTSHALERKILELYGSGLNLTAEEATAALEALHFDAGDLSFAPMAQAGVKAFQRAWDLRATGILDAGTIRTLAFVTASRSVVTIPAA